MYWFKENEKDKVLQGRTIKYLAENELFVNKDYLCQILSSKKGCSKLLARNITNCICRNAKINDYFTKKGE